MARERYLVGVSEDELRPEPKPEPPKTPKGKLENFWYHYKWHTIIGVAVIIVAVILIAQLVNRTTYDYEIILVTEQYVPEDARQRLKAEFLKNARDINGDGSIEILMENLYIGSSDSTSNMTNIQKLNIYIASGDKFLFLFDKSSYDSRYREELNKDGYIFFDTLKTDLAGMDDTSRLWNWKDSELRREAVFQNMPEELYFGVRRVAGTSEKYGEEQADAKELLETTLRPKADYTLVAATQEPLPEGAAARLAAIFEQYGEDRNGDGRVTVSTVSLPVGTDSKTKNGASEARLDGYLGSSDIFLFVFDKETYEKRFEELIEAGEPFFEPPNTAAGVDATWHYWNWRDSSLRGDETLAGLPEELYFGVMRLAVDDPLVAEWQKEYLALFNAFLADR